MEKLNNKGELQRLARVIERNCPEYFLDKEGGAAFSKGQVDRAISLFDRAIQANPAWYGPYFDKAICLSKMGRHDEALELFMTADALNPYNSELYFMVGETYRTKGNFEKMKEYWRKSLKYDPENDDTFIGLSTYYLDNNMADSALYYLSILSPAAYDPVSYYYRGVAYLKKLDTAAAKEQFQKYMEVGTDSTVIRDILKFREEAE